MRRSSLRASSHHRTVTTFLWATWDQPRPIHVPEADSWGEITRVKLISRVVSTKALQENHWKIPVSIRNITDLPVKLKQQMLLRQATPAAPSGLLGGHRLNIGVNISSTFKTPHYCKCNVETSWRRVTIIIRKMSILSTLCHLSGACCLGRGSHYWPKNVEAVISWPRHNNVTELKSFLGFCFYFQKCPTPQWVVKEWWGRCGCTQAN